MMGFKDLMSNVKQNDNKVETEKPATFQTSNE